MALASGTCRRACVHVPLCVQGGGGGTVAHLLAPLMFGVGAHVAGKCVPSAPGPCKEAGELDSEPAAGDVGLGSQPPQHKDMLPNHSTAAYWHGKAVVCGMTGSDTHSSTAVGTRGTAAMRVGSCSPRLRAYPGQAEGR